MNRSNRLRCLLLVLACLPSWTLAADDKQADAAPGAGPGADKPAQTAIDAAKDYTAKMKSGQPAAAIQAYWDMDAMLGGMFGEHLRRHSDEERARMKQLLLEFVEKVYASPSIAQAMANAKFEDFTVAEDEPRGATTVKFNWRLADKAIPNSVQMKQSDGKWRIVDAGVNGRMMVPALRDGYLPKAEKVTPLQFVQGMVAREPPTKK
jgi:ABC-type transporter MlaC component